MDPMHEPRTIDDLTTEELREWLVDWLLWTHAPHIFAFDGWGARDYEQAHEAVGRDAGEWRVLRDELLSAYAERAK